jgi:putative phosphoribosyl transferase
MIMPSQTSSRTTPVRLRAGTALIDGDLAMPDGAAGLVLFAHGSGSSRLSQRNRSVGRALEEAGFGTLLLDLLTADEEAIDVRTREYRFDIDRLAGRVVAAVDWAADQPALARLPICTFGASTGAAAALIAAAERPDAVRAVISRGGRPDLAGAALGRVYAPTLLIVGGLDAPVIKMNCDAMRRIPGPVILEIVPEATHLFEEPGALAAVSRLSADWCRRYLRAQDPAVTPTGRAHTD